MIQIIKCKCGKTFAAATEPHCYSDADWQRDTRKYIKRGCTVEMVDHHEWKFEECVCETPAKAKKNPNQLELF
jgi:hypothetical protein